MTERIGYIDGIKALGCILIVFLHSYSGGESADLILHILTRVAVPMFMAVSGYLIFFTRHSDDKFWIKMLKRYVPLFLFWFIAYVLYTYYLLGANNDISVFQYALTNCDGWAYWYLVVLIEILVAYPIIKVIVSNEFALKYYIALWLIMVSCKQVLTIRSIPKQFFDIFQLPFFQTREYIGGTVLAHYPTECLGVFVTLGLLVRSLTDGKVTSIKKCIIALAGVMSFFGIMLYAGRLITTERPIDLIMQPIQIQVVMMSAAGILLF